MHLCNLREYQSHTIQGSGALGFTKLSPRNKGADRGGSGMMIPMIVLFIVTTVGVFFFVFFSSKSATTNEAVNGVYNAPIEDKEVPSVEDEVAPPRINELLHTHEPENGHPDQTAVIEEEPQQHSMPERKGGEPCDKDDDVVQCAILVRFAEALHYEKWTEANGWLRCIYSLTLLLSCNRIL